MRTLAIFCAVIAVLMVNPIANACKCAPPPPPKEALLRADAVFVGTISRVERIVQGGQLIGLRATFTVTRYWKGITTPIVTVTTPPAPSICGFDFKTEQSYLIYASGAGTEFSTNICTRTKLIRDVDPEEQQLGPAKQTK